MLSLQTVEQLKTQLAAGQSYRAVARQLGVSRGVVALAARGRRPDYAAREEPLANLPEGPLERCPSCGGRSTMPCRLCLIRARRESRPQLAQSLSLLSEAPLGLELRPAHQARYEQVRLARFERRRRGEPEPTDEGEPQ